MIFQHGHNRTQKFMNKNSNFNGKSKKNSDRKDINLQPTSKIIIKESIKLVPDSMHQNLETNQNGEMVRIELFPCFATQVESFSSSLSNVLSFLCQALKPSSKTT
jgi:hypothetical protein